MQNVQKMLKKTRMILAGLCFVGMLLLFLDVSGFFPQRLAFLAKIQLVPAILAGSVVIVTVLLGVTLLFGRVYCSVVCPLGIYQDIAGFFGKKNRFRYTAAKTTLRMALLIAFAAAVFFGLPLVFGILEPYGAFGRIASSLFAPIWIAGSNWLAYVSETTGYLMLARTPMWIRGFSALTVAAVTFVVVGYLAFRGGRTWCNAVCPIGTALGFISRFSLLRPRIVAASCNGCGLCEKNCKASCIDAKNNSIDASRCVACFNCVDTCRRDAIKYSLPQTTAKAGDTDDHPDATRRSFIVAALGFLTVPAFLRMAVAKDASDEDIAALTRKRRQPKDVPVIPPGAGGLRSYSAKCTGCQLCVSACLNNVLASFDKGLGMLQPSLTFERGYCRVNCVECSTVCPTGAIRQITIEEKSMTQIGRARIDRERCIRSSKNTACTTCIRNCPAGAINAIEREDGSKDIAVDEERCVGCGACEYFCPVRPTGAIVVQGNLEHRRI